MARSNSISENGIVFFSSGGHSHNGQNSSLISTSSYSIYDFSPSFVGDNPERRRSQVNNFNSFKQLVINTVNSAVLEPAGIVLQENIINSRNIISGSITSEEIAANTITSNNIAAGTITADLFSANIVLVGQQIQSNNYVPDVSGWVINGDGTAQFDSASIRGGLIANSVSTPGIDILANGAIVSTNFNVSPDGTITANAGTFSGRIDIGGFDGDSFHVDTTGAMWIGSATFAGAKFKVAANGVVYAGDGGVVIDTNNITSGGNYTGNLTLGPAAYSGNPGLLVNYTAGVSSTYASGYYQMSGASGGFIRADASGTNPGVKVQVGGQSCELFKEGISFNGEEKFAFTKGGPGVTLYAIVNGTDYYPIYSTASDRRVKENIDSNINSSINKLLNDINLYEFNFKDTFDDPSIRHVGVIADEISNVFPNVVYTNKLPNEETPDSLRMVNYGYFVPILMATVQSLNERIKALEAQLGV